MLLDEFIEKWMSKNVPGNWAIENRTTLIISAIKAGYKFGMDGK